MEDGAVQVIRKDQLEVAKVKLIPGNVMALALPLRAHAAKTVNTPNVLVIHVEIMMQVSKARTKVLPDKKKTNFQNNLVSYFY